MKAELQALKDSRQATPDTPGNTGREADQPRLDNRGLPVDQDNVEDAEPKDDRPGVHNRNRLSAASRMTSILRTRTRADRILMAQHLDNDSEERYPTVADLGGLPCMPRHHPCIRVGWVSRLLRDRRQPRDRESGQRAEKSGPRPERAAVSDVKAVPSRAANASLEAASGDAGRLRIAAGHAARVRRAERRPSSRWLGLWCP